MKRRIDPHFAAYYRWLILTRHLGLQVRTEDKILDVGCDDAFFLSQQRARLRVGVDLKPRTLPHNTLYVVTADACALPFADESFSVVFAFDVIEHISNDASFIASIIRVLSKGGILWLSVPANKPYFLSVWLTRWLMGRWGHKRIGYDVEELLNLFPPDYSIYPVCWNTYSFRWLYVLLWLVSKISRPLARLGARLCFEVDKHLTGNDHIFLKIVRQSV